MKSIQLLFVSCFCFFSSIGLNAEVLLTNRIQKLIADSRFDNAITLIDSALVLEGVRPDLNTQDIGSQNLAETSRSNVARLFAWKGASLKELYAFDDAINAYNLAIMLDSGNTPRYMIEAASVCKLKQDYQQALVYYEKAFKRDSSNKYLLIEKANCEFLTEQYLPALNDFHDFYLKDSLNVYVVKCMGSCFTKLGLYDQAIELYVKALKIHPYDDEAVLSLARLYQKIKDYKAGIQITESFREKDSANKAINSLNAMLYFSNKETEIAVERFKSCLEKGDSSKFVYKNLGIAYFTISEFDSAKIHLEKAYQLDSEDVNVLHLLGISCYESFYKELGIKYLEKAITLYEPEERNIAMVYKNFSEACARWSPCPLEKILNATLMAYQYNPKDANLALSLSDIYERLKDYSNAVVYLEIYLKDLRSQEKGGTAVNSRSKNLEDRLQKLKEKAALAPAV